MKVSIDKIVSAVNKLSDVITSESSKQVPGVMLEMSENLLKVCYFNQHTAFTENIEVETDETDKMGAYVVDSAQLKRAINSCKPTGKIKVEEVYITVKDKIMTISAEQMYADTDAEGNVVGTRNIANKSMDLAWVEAGSDLRSSIFTRMNYDDIFVSDGIDDVFDKAELLDALARTSTEKGKQIYISTKTQTIFVSNQAHVTAVPVSKAKVLNQEELDTIRAELTEAGNFSDETYAEAIAKAENRMHYSIVMTQAIAKAIIGVFGKVQTDSIYVHTKDKFCSVFVESDGEHVGLWFDMPVASKAHIGALDRYNSLKYDTYQLSFLRDFLVDSISSASEINKGAAIFKFEQNEDTGELELVIKAGSSQASVSDVYKVKASTATITDASAESVFGTLLDKEFKVSIEVFKAMLDQLKTDIVTLDINCENDASTIRLAELDFAVEEECYKEARRETERLCKEQGIAFDASSTPTPSSLKTGYRASTLKTKQFTMLAK